MIGTGVSSLLIASGPLGISGSIVALIVALLCGNLVLSLVAFRRLDRSAPARRAAGAWPRIAVLIPARNEAATIGACLRSLLAQEYPNVAILVLDDQSEDDTGAIVTAIAAKDGRVRLLRGTPLPPGWLGKCHACAQLANAAADADYLLFTDADTVHGPRSVAQALGAMEGGHLGLLSVLPRQRAVTFAEQLLLPLLPLSILMLLPVGLVARRPEPSLSAGIGQLLCMRRATYQSIGGHAAVRDQVLDDVMLARRAKAAGGRADLLDGGDAVQCRMYTSFGAIWRGFSKNQFDFYGRSIGFTMLAVLLQLALFVAPLPIDLIMLAQRQPWLAIAPWLAAYLLAVAMRLLIAARVGGPGTDLRSPGAILAAWLAPLAAALQVAITLNSLRWGLTGKLSWKGRTYPSSHAGRGASR